MKNIPVRICFICTHSLTLATLYKGLFPYLEERGYYIEAVVGDAEYMEFPEEYFGNAKVNIVPMKRMPHPLKDILSLVRMMRLLAAGKFDIVHVSTPKASIIGSVAARLVGCRAVIFVYRRCVYELMSGFKRWFYQQADRITCALSDVVLPISKQIEKFLINEKIVSSRKVRMIGSGSSNGIDINRFSPASVSRERIEELKSQLDIESDKKVLLFIGRVCREKGVEALPSILDHVRNVHRNTVLIVAGPDDERDPPSQETKTRFEDDPSIIRLGYINNPAEFYALTDVFVFPSYFEGFGNVLLEAAAQEKVAVGFDVPGVQEAICHGKSGFLVPKNDIPAMADVINHLLENEAERERMAIYARHRVESEFSNERIWSDLDRTFTELVRPTRAS